MKWYHMCNTKETRCELNAAKLRTQFHTVNHDSQTLTTYRKHNHVTEHPTRRIDRGKTKPKSTAQAEAEEHEWGSETEVTRAETPSIFDGQAGQRKTQKKEASHVR